MNGLREVAFVLKNLTRARAIGLWFAVMAVIVAGSIVAGVSVMGATGLALLALLLVPPAIALMMWPTAQPQTVAEVLRDVDSR